MPKSPPPERRQPLLADYFLAHRGPHDKYVHPRTMEQLLRATRAAHRLVFDEEAIERVAEVIMRVPDLLCREQQFARPPFDICWIEFQPWKMMEVFRRHEASTHVIETADNKAAYLIDHNRVNTISWGTRQSPTALPPFVSPIQYRLHTEWLPEEQDEMARIVQVSRLTFDQMMWGSSWDHLDTNQRRALRANHAIELTPYKPAAKDQWESAAYRIMPMINGDMRNLVAMLLMLNRPTITKYVQVEPGRGFWRGKNMPYLSHTTVKVDLDAVATIRLVGTEAGEGVPRRRHEVWGHWRHNKTARDMQRIAGCVHEWRRCMDDEWTPLPVQDRPYAEEGRWMCAACGGKRSWVRAHERGDASIGYVIRDGYQVTRL